MSYKNQQKQVPKKKIYTLSGRLCNYTLKRLLKVIEGKKRQQQTFKVITWQL